MEWCDATKKRYHPSRSDWASELEWIKETGFTQRAAYISSDIVDFPNMVKGKRRRTKNGVNAPVPMDHLSIYRNPLTNHRIAVFHEYQDSAHVKEPILESFCEENGLTLSKLNHSWYYPGVTVTFTIQIKEAF